MKKETPATVSWDTDDRLNVTPTGWSERKYDVNLLYGSPKVGLLHAVVVSVGYHTRNNCWCSWNVVVDAADVDVVAGCFPCEQWWWWWYC